MKNSILLLISLLLVSIQANSQSTDRFIRIVGNASHTFEADSRVFDITVSEIPGNEFKKINQVPFEEVHSQFIAELGKIGIDEIDLDRNDKKTSRANQSNSRNYLLTINDKSKGELLMEITIDGVNISPGHFIYQPADPLIESQLAFEAIEDAKRKAENIGKEVGMRVGKILNIEDTSSGCCEELKPSKESSITVKYQVNVTFELKDK